MMKKLLEYLWRGFLWGNTILVINLAVIEIRGDNIIDSILLEDFTLSVIVFTMLGIGIGAGTIVYTFDRLSTLQQTVIHLAISLCAFMGILFAFVELSTTNIVSNILFFLLIFFVIWGASYLYWKDEAKKINEVLKRRNTEG